MESQHLRIERDLTEHLVYLFPNQDCLLSQAINLLRKDNGKKVEFYIIKCCCYKLNCVFPDLYVEPLTLDVIVFGEVIFQR